MKLAGFTLLPAGWLLVLAAVILLGMGGPQTIFLCAGLGVEVVGLILVFRSHLIPGEEKR